MTNAEITRRINDLPEDVVRHLKNEGAQAERKAIKRRVDTMEKNGAITSGTGAKVRWLIDLHKKATRQRPGGLGL